MAAVATRTLALTGVRTALADVLAPSSEGDPAVLADIPDAISPPMLILEWADPWLTPRTVGRGWWDAHLNVVCFAGRLEPGPGVGVLEQLVGYVLNRLDADGSSWPVESMTSPRRFDYGGITYLGARIQLLVPVTPDLEVTS